MRREISEYLLYRHSDVALACIWMLMDYTNLKPKTGKPFPEWKWPPCELEFDHAGSFSTLPGSLFFYEGGETKLSADGIYPHNNGADELALKDAKLQLERRLKLIDFKFG